MSEKFVAVEHVPNEEVGRLLAEIDSYQYPQVTSTIAVIEKLHPRIIMMHSSGLSIEKIFEIINKNFNIISIAAIKKMINNEKKKISKKAAEKKKGRKPRVPKDVVQVAEAEDQEHRSEENITDSVEQEKRIEDPPRPIGEKPTEEKQESPNDRPHFGGGGFVMRRDRDRL